MVSKINIQQNRSRKMMLLLGAIFVLPMLIAWFVFSTVDDWGMTDTRNKGNLIRPAQPLQEFSLVAQDGSVFELEQMRKKWTLVYIGNGTCDKECESVIYKTRQVRLAQGKEMHRVRRVFVLNDLQLSDETKQYYSQAHPDLVLVDGNANQLTGFLRQFEIGGKDASTAGRLYIVDPLGNLMMNYEPGFNAEWLLKDLRRLLHVSQIG
ncbi:MAG: SCO family protein [Gammaproteobacteria bacterium]|nr:SCO family protein [Gammaproteobacteria bacterium]